MNDQDWVKERRRRGLSIEWHAYQGTGIEVFFDHAAVLYRIEGQIYAVPRQLVMMTSEQDGKPE